MSDEVDILQGQQNVDLSNTDTSYPVLKAGNYEFSVAQVEEVQNKAGTGKNLKISLQLEQLAKTIADVDQAPGLKLTHNISMVQTQKYDPRKNLAVFQEASLGRKGLLYPLEQYVGTRVVAQVKVTTDDQYGTRNEIARFLKKG